jgi:hypothetical protein
MVLVVGELKKIGGQGLKIRCNLEKHTPIDRVMQVGFHGLKLLSFSIIYSNSNNVDIGATGKVGVCESPLRDRLVYLTTCLIGHPVEVQLKNGSVYSGTCYTTNAEKEFGKFCRFSLVEEILHLLLTVL